jgi:type I restriction enzyme R subunit
LKLPKDESEGGLVLDDEVALAYYRLEKVLDGTIALKAGESPWALRPDRGRTRTAKEDVPLSEIIDVLRRFGTQFKPADQLFFSRSSKRRRRDQTVAHMASANELDNFSLALKPRSRFHARPHGADRTSSGSTSTTRSSRTRRSGSWRGGYSLKKRT